MRKGEIRLVCREILSNGGYILDDVDIRKEVEVRSSGIGRSITA
jgi:hypothetical protein